MLRFLFELFSSFSLPAHLSPQDGQNNNNEGRWLGDRRKWVFILLYDILP